MIIAPLSYLKMMRMPMELIKQIANRYDIISLIGQGGMADVFKAKDIILNRIVAIKVLRPKLSDDAMTLVRFQREASAASRLSHPNVVDIYDVGEYEEMHYIVMEYIRGRTLKQMIAQRGALSVSESIHIMMQLTSAICHAHAHHIIHRDIKPQNVLVKDDGTVKITDFGIAIANDAVQLTLNNAVMGSAHYLAPETAQGKDATEQVDIYSLGIVFYELLTGDVPFHGKTPTEIAVKHLREPIPYVRDFNASIPQSVENIILKATAKNPANRYKKTDDMLDDLEHCMDWNRRNESRIEFEAPNITKVDVNDGHVQVEYSDEPVKEEKNPIQWKSVGLGLIAVSLICALILLSATASGKIKIDGFLGYETIPDVVDQNYTDAELALKKHNFHNIKVKKVLSDTVPKDEVISTNYDSGEVIQSSNQIVLTVSKGPGYFVKDFTGRTISDVRKEIKESGVNLTIKIKYKDVADTDPNIVLSQRGIKAGKRIDPNKKQTITFTVSRYPSIVIPEKLIGMEVNAAKEYLNDKGIAVVLSGVSNDNEQGYVVSVDPVVGARYTQEGSDSVVTLFYE